MKTLLIPAFLLVALMLTGCERTAAGEDEAPPARSAVLADQDFVIEAVTAEALLQEVAAVDADLVVVNFWASWCLPCRKEFPDLMRFDQEHDDIAVRFVSVDFEDDLEFAAEFLREQEVSGTTYLKTGADQAFITTIAPDWTGSIPATAVYNRGGERLTFWEGKVTYEQLAERVAAVRTRS